MLAPTGIQAAVAAAVTPGSSSASSPTPRTTPAAPGAAASSSASPARTARRSWPASTGSSAISGGRGAAAAATGSWSATTATSATGSAASSSATAAKFRRPVAAESMPAAATGRSACGPATATTSRSASRPAARASRSTRRCASRCMAARRPSSSFTITAHRRTPPSRSRASRSWRRPTPSPSGISSANPARGSCKRGLANLGEAFRARVAEARVERAAGGRRAKTKRPNSFPRPSPASRPARTRRRVANLAGGFVGPSGARAGGGRGRRCLDPDAEARAGVLLHDADRHRRPPQPAAARAGLQPDRRRPMPTSRTTTSRSRRRSSNRQPTRVRR